MMKDASHGQQFGLTTAVFLVVANMVGASIFTTSGYALGDLGSSRTVLLAWLCGGIIAICGAVAYGAASRMVRESGGEYVFLSRMLHPAIGFMAGWVSLLAGFTGAIAFAAATFEAYALPANWRPDWLPVGSLAIAAILLFALLHSWIARVGVNAQNGIVAIKLALLVIFLGIALGPLYGNWPTPEQHDAWLATAESPTVLAFASSLIWISLAYSGFNCTVYVASEIRHARRNVPLSMVLGTAIVTGFYLLLNFVFVCSADPSILKGQEDVAAVAANAIGGDKFAGFVRGIVVVAMLSSVSSMILAGPRVYEKMAEDGLFPKWMKARNQQQSAPHIAVWVQAVLACLVVAVTSLKDLLDYLSLTLAVSAALTILAMLNYAARNRSAERPGWIAWACGSLYVIATFALASVAAWGSPQKLWGLGVTIVSGAIGYAVVKSRALAGKNKRES